MKFGRPIIGPKCYLARGPSGHAETFRRPAADLALGSFVGDRLSIAVEGFLRKMKLAGRPEEWSDVIDYIGEFTKTDADLVPIDVSVAFWARTIEQREADKRAKAPS